MLYSILTFILVINVILFYLDEYKLSKNTYIKFSQMLSPILLLIIVIILYNEFMMELDNTFFMSDNDKTPNVSISAGLEVNNDAAVKIGKGINSVGNNIGLAGSIAAITSGVAKVVGTSALPPVRRAAIVMAGGTLGGIIHAGITALNDMKFNSHNIISDKFLRDNSKINSNTNKLIDDTLYSFQDSELKTLLLSIDIINYTNFILVILLFSMLAFKFIEGPLDLNNVNLKWNHIIGDKFNKTLNYYLTKIIKLNKKTQTVYIFIILFLLFTGLGYNCYFVTELYNNLDLFIYLHINKN